MEQKAVVYFVLSVIYYAYMVMSDLMTNCTILRKVNCI